MMLHVDNKGAVDLAKTGVLVEEEQGRHVEVRYYFFKVAERKNVILFNWVSTESNFHDLFTKNFSGPTFERHVQVFCLC